MTRRWNTLTVVLIIGFQSFVFAPLSSADDPPPAYVTDVGQAENVLTYFLQMGSFSLTQLLIIDYCRKSPEQLKKVCQSVSNKITSSEDVSIVEKSDDKYKCQYRRISWVTSDYKNANDGVILPFIPCFELKAKKTDCSPNKKEEKCDKFTTYYMLGFGKLYQIFLFVPQSDENPATKISDESETKKNKEGKKSLENPLLESGGEGSGYYKKYFIADHSTLATEKHGPIISITSEAVASEDYKGPMMCLRGIVQANPTELIAVLEEVDTAWKDQVGSSKSEQVDVAKKDQVRPSTPEQVDTAENFQVRPSTPEQVDIAKKVLVSSLKPKQVDTAKNVQIESLRLEEVDAAKKDQVGSLKLEEVDAAKKGQVRSSAARIIRTVDDDKQR